MAYTSILQKLSKNLTTTYENTIFDHPGDIGDTREKEVINYLRKVMPKKFGFDSGEVFDKNDIKSGQIDIIIYDNLFSTIFTDGTNKIVAPVESVYGILSIKSKMGIRELDNAIEGIKKFDLLERTKAIENAIYVTPDMPIEGGKGISFSKNHQQNINCIFAFDTTISEKTIIKKVKDSGCIDMIIIPGKFCLIGRYRSELGFSMGDGSKMSNAIIYNENAISVFITMLQVYLSKNHLVSRDLRDLAVWIIKESKVLI